MTTIALQRVALVTGASSGIGQAAALSLHEAGFLVYGAARRADRMQELRDQGVRTLTMDVTDDESMTLGIKQLLLETGRIDVLVNNAGYGSYGALEDVPLEEARRQFEVNVFGAARLTQLVLPGMRTQRSGTIVNISSMGGRLHTPFGSWYHGTKFALEAVSDCLRIEVKPFGIDVVVIEPGGVRTEWSGIAADHLEATSGQGAYAGQASAVARAFRSERMTKRASPPEVVAKAVTKAVTSRRPKTRYAVGSGAKPLIFLRRWLPDRTYDAFIRRVTGLR